MKRAELLVLMAVSCGMIVVALAMLFGALGLLGCGVALLAAALVADPLDLARNPKRKE